MNRALAAVALCGCTDFVQLDTHLSGLIALEVAPADTTLAITGLDAPVQSIAFTATGRFADGSVRDVTSYVVWGVDNPLPGAIDPRGVYTTSNAAAGHVAVRASANAVTGAARLTVTVDATIVDATFPPPGDPGTLFSGTPVTDPMRSPVVSYPSDRTAFPQGVARTLVQYARGNQNDAFRLTFANDVLHLVVFTGSDRWSADGAIWTMIAGSGIHAPIRLVVDGTASNASGIYASTPVALTFSRDTPGGLIAYWSAASSGVMRGALGATAAAKLYPGDATCVGCHAISRDGRAMALGYGGETLQTLALPALTTEISATDKLPMGWATYSPDGAIVLVANKGALALYDAATGAPIGSPDGHVHLPPMTFATHPDWSPDGSAVAVALTMAAPTNMDVKGASIAVLAWDGAKLGAPQVLVRAAGMDNYYFPKWSPDGQYLAFVHATTSSHGAATAELELISAGGGTPSALAAASHRVASVDSVANLADTMPAWSPLQGDFAWLAFASTRPYGAVLPAPGRGQVWIAGLDLSRGGDPSYAAFWMPCQDVTVLNNNPIWSAVPQTTE